MTGGEAGSQLLAVRGLTTCSACRKAQVKMRRDSAEELGASSAKSAAQC